MTIKVPILPNPSDPMLTKRVTGVDQNGVLQELPVVEERPLTIFLNSQEIITAMTIGDYPDYLAIGFLLNQKMLLFDDRIEKIDYDEDLQTIVIRTLRKTSYEKKLQQKTRTSGCAVGTVFGDMLEGLDDVELSKNKVKTSWIYALAKKINTTPSLYLSAGAIHGTVLCEKSTPLIYMEDVGRHNAVDKISGWMFINGIKASDKILYTTGRLTSEMIIKSALMGIPTLISRSGFTAWGVEIANNLGMTLIGRLRGRRFICLSGEKRLVRDADPKVISDEKPKDNRKAGND
ncbi:MAG: sulfurtransferase FdhD [Rhodobacteraceae bacterium]|jgi:FdhD protein|nr:sulfurtransferase FdhD [Paracoccaceae bacterium]|tara:strand:+ start:6293 stop:7162 length:870 start_codon:yes stop_codon:yes gene_type:complete